MTSDVQSIVDSLINSTIHQHLQPSYLGDEDEHHDRGWWDWYGSSSETTSRPHKMKIINTTMYTRPKSTNDIYIKGRYFQIPDKVGTPAGILPYGNLFDETYREGVVKILTTGIAAPETDPVFAEFIYRDVDVVLQSRVRMVKSTHRVGRHNFI